MDIPAGDGQGQVRVTAWPGGSLGPKTYVIKVPAGARGPGVDAPPRPPRQGTGVPPKPRGG